jgi:hypothetical protein
MIEDEEEPGLNEVNWTAKFKRFLSGKKFKDSYILPYLLQKIERAELPKDVEQFTDIEIEAMEKIICGSALWQAKLWYEFRKVCKGSKKIWKLLVITITGPLIEKRLEKEFEEVYSSFPNKDYYRNAFFAPWRLQKENPEIEIMLKRLRSDNPHQKKEHPDTMAEWWEPMSVTDYCWAIGKYPAFIKKLLTSINAKPISKNVGRRPAKYSVETNLKVLRTWLSSIKDTKRKQQIGEELLRALKIKKRVKYCQEMSEGNKKDFQIIFGFASKDRYLQRVIENEPLPYEGKITKLVKASCKLD